MDKYFALLKNKKNVKEVKMQEARISAAQFLLKQIYSGSLWLRTEAIRMLYFYLDFDFVKNALMNLYKTTKEEEIKQAIKGLHDGTLDVSDLIKEREEYKEYEKMAEEARAELENELDDNVDDSELELVKFKNNNFQSKTSPIKISKK